VSGVPLWWRIGLGTLVAALMLVLLWWWRPVFLLPGARPLVMEGGDPHLRALMRTISVAESNALSPYHVLHGGKKVHSLSVHPNRCERIGAGTNRGNCSTAAGRYQVLYGTWLELVPRYHPEWRGRSSDPAQMAFSPWHQDQVVHAWLSDQRVWNMNLAEQLRGGRVQVVLRRLSGTWTSLGYGIESNSMSRELPRVYKTLLADELQRTGAPQTPR